VEVFAMLHSTRRFLAVLGAALLVGSACGGTPAASPAPSATEAATAATAQLPTKAAEFVISTAPGGGSDIYARAMQAIIDKEKLSPQPVQPINKEGGSGAVAFTYVFEKKGDMHYIMITLNSFFTTIITQKLPYSANDFTPIANLALDPFILWVNADSPWKTAQDVITAAKDKSIVVSGTGSKQEDEALFRRIEATAGTKAFTYVPQSGGGAVATALAGKQGGVELTVNNPSEGRSLMQQGRLRAICAFSAAPLKAAAFSSIPTCSSQGLAIDDYFVMRAIMGPPGLTAAQQKFWVDTFKKVYDTKDWQDFMETNALNPDFRSGVEFRQFINNYEKLHKDIAAQFKWV
jgi:putative tricarboxylic transport membrane protein